MPSSQTSSLPRIPPSDRYDQALVWAAQLHREQFRKGKAVPYFSHLISVSALVWEDEGAEDQAISGLLHNDIPAIYATNKWHLSLLQKNGHSDPHYQPNPGHLNSHHPPHGS